MVTSFKRGHKIYFDFGKHEWLYVDNNTPIINERPCIRCGQMPTKDGHDACIGYINNVKSACCGHGAERQIMIKKQPSMDRLIPKLM